MKKYTLVIKNSAKRQLSKLPESVYKVLKTAIDGLVDDPRPRGCKKLKLSNNYRIRKGDYRIIYNIEDDKIIVTVLKVGHRQNVYND